MPTSFNIPANEFLVRGTIGYFNRHYTGYGNTSNPDFLNTLKNTFKNTNINNLNQARREVEGILIQDIPYIMLNQRWNDCVCVCVPRAKELSTYAPTQLFFRDAVSNAAVQIPNAIDGTRVIQRHQDTRTTHLGLNVARVMNNGQTRINDGLAPYPGITLDTCAINNQQINGRNIILIDDIYTNGVNIDEDCIQALFNSGAREVVFYAVAYTRRYA